ncbi:MAG: hypothetical protein U0359_27020 [Byssovorax sp.]
MDSSIPPPPSYSSQRKLRPWYLVPAMVLTWVYGMNGLMAGCANMAFLREATVPDVTEAMNRAKGAIDPSELVSLSQAVWLQGMHDLSRITFPLAIAQILLSGLLVMASGLAMSGRKGARALVLQALGANAVLSIALYVGTESVRAACIETLVRAAQTLPPELPAREAFSRPDLLWLVFRIKLIALDLGTLALGALALTRGRSKTYFEAMAKATESAEEP